MSSRIVSFFYQLPRTSVRTAMPTALDLSDFSVSDWSRKARSSRSLVFLKTARWPAARETKAVIFTYLV